MFFPLSHAGFAEEPSELAEPKAIPVELFVKQMQLLARRNPVGTTKVQKGQSLEELRREVAAQFDGQLIEYEVRLTSVDWYDGMATLKTQNPIPNFKPNRRLPFSFTMSQPLKIPMTREKAASLSMRTRLRFVGTLKLVSGVTVVHNQQPKLYSAFWVRHSEYRPFDTVGAFVSTDYSVFLGDEEVFALHPAAGNP